MKAKQQSSNQKNSKKLKITLVKSPIGFMKKHKACLQSLGLRKLNHHVEHFDTPSIRGMVQKIGYLLKVEEISI